MQIRTLCLFIFSLPCTLVSGNFTSKIVYPENGRLAYVSDGEDNRIPDFSHAGYKGGGVPLPDVPVKITLDPVTGNNSPQIQAALDQVGTMTPDANGIRGAVKLNPGTYPIENNLVIQHSGVVLRGSGDGADPQQDSIIRAARSMRNTVLTAGGTLSNWNPAPSALSVDITSDFVPVGSRSFEISGNAQRSFAVGDNIVIRHPSTQEWLNAIDGGGTASGAPWSPGEEDIYFNRHITAINGNTITVDAPIYNHLDRSLSQSYLYRVNRNGLISEVGVEDLRIHIETADPTDEDHAESGLFFRGVENGWARNVTVRHFLLTAIGTQASTFITVRDSRALDPHSIITGARRYPFNTIRFSNNILFEGCYANDGRHCFVSNGISSVSGVVFYNSTSHRAFAASEGHRRWSQGMLFDNLTFTSPNTTNAIGFYNRGSYGTSHGWAAVHSVAWNCDVGSRKIIIQKPPTGQNYGIGNRGEVTGAGPFNQPAGYIEGTGQNILPASLYQAQLNERLNYGIAPDAPIGLEATRDKDGAVRLAWKHIGTEKEVQFLVERWANQGQNWQLIATVGASPTADLADLAAGTYRYRVRSSGQGGLSAYSSPVEAVIPGLVMDFENEFVGEKPAEATNISPATNIGTTLPFPISSGDGGPIGVLIINENSSPVSAINGRSVRIYDYSTTGKAKLSKLFVPDPESAFPGIRFDFTFRRSVAMKNEDGNPGQGLILGLGAPDSSTTMLFNAGYAMTLRLHNEGTIRVVGQNFSSIHPFEPFSEISAHTISIFANAKEEPVTYKGPDGVTRMLEGYHFSVFLNRVLLNENRFKEKEDGTPLIPVLGKLAFTTGQGTPNTNIDFVFDDIQISSFSQTVESPALSSLQITPGEAQGSLILFWETTAGTSYLLQHSSDLQNWTAIDGTFSANGENIEYPLDFKNTERGFYRLTREE